MIASRRSPLSLPSDVDCAGLGSPAGARAACPTSPIVASARCVATLSTYARACAVATARTYASCCDVDSPGRTFGTTTKIASASTAAMIAIATAISTKLCPCSSLGVRTRRDSLNVDSRPKTHYSTPPHLGHLDRRPEVQLRHVVEQRMR